MGIGPVLTYILSHGQSTFRTLAVQMHPPTIIFVMLFGLALASALLAGYAMAGTTTRSWLHITGFAAITAAAVYVILDLEHPRLGLFQMEVFDQALMSLLASLK